MSVWKKKASDSDGQTWENAPQGTHVARLVAIIDLGSHDELKTQEGKPDKMVAVRKGFLVWELVACAMSGFKDRNHLIGRKLSLSLNKKAAMRKIVHGMLGRALDDDEEFDISELLGQPCMVSVEHSKSGDKTFANFGQAMALPAAVPCPPAKHPVIQWELDDGLEKLPDLSQLPRIYGEEVADVIRACKELRGDSHEPARKPEPVHVGPDEDSIPF